MCGRAPFGDSAASTDFILRGAEARRSWESSACSSWVSAPSACRMWTVWTAKHVWYFHCDSVFFPVEKQLIYILVWNKAQKNSQALNGLCLFYCYISVICAGTVSQEIFSTIWAIFLEQLHKKSHNIWKVKYESNFLQHTTRGTEICKQQARMKLQWQQLPRPGGVWRQGCMTSVLF